MAPFRIPFTSRKPVASNGIVVSDENAAPIEHINAFGRDKPSVALGVKEKREEPNEFKLSSVTDNGEYMPPSPVDKKTFWGGKSPSNVTTTHRSVLSENEPFSISRESFESYRRSFDISGRSPIIHSDSYTSRTSLDSRSMRLPRPAVNESTHDRPSTTKEEDSAFEEVGLNEDPTKPKKRSFLSRFGETSTTTDDDGKTHHHFHLLSGRKRGQSGTGSELGNMETVPNRPASKGQIETVRV